MFKDILNQSSSLKGEACMQLFSFNNFETGSKILTGSNTASKLLQGQFASSEKSQNENESPFGQGGKQVWIQDKRYYSQTLIDSQNRQFEEQYVNEYHHHQGQPSEYQNDEINYYQEAKRCELQDSDLDGAVYFYNKCLEINQKRDSAIKDLATVYHKQGKTQIALELLLIEKENYSGDIKSYENLITTLNKQLVPTGKVYLRFILMYNCSNEPILPTHIAQIFPKSKKVKQMFYFEDLSLLTKTQTPNHICVLEFNSYSNAKKVIEGSQISTQNETKCFLIDIMGKVKIHIADSKTYDRELVEYQNPYLKPSTFPESLLFLYKGSQSQELINSQDKKYTWLQDTDLFQSDKNYGLFFRETKRLENELIIKQLLSFSQNNSSLNLASENSNNEIIFIQ